MNEERKRIRRPWLTALIVLVLAVVMGQAAYLFYIQRQVVTTLNGVYGELAASPELNALLDLNAALPNEPATGEPNDEAASAPPPADLDKSLKDLEGLLGPNSSGAIKQLMDMTRQLAESYDAASGVAPAPQPKKSEPAAATAPMPDIALSETDEDYRLEMNFGNVTITHLAASAEEQIVRVEGNVAGKTRRSTTPFMWSISLNEPIDPDSLTLANDGNVYTVTVSKKPLVT